MVFYACDTQIREEFGEVSSNLRGDTEQDRPVQNEILAVILGNELWHKIITDESVDAIAHFDNFLFYSLN